MINPMIPYEYKKPIAIDDWVPDEKDIIFRHLKNKVILPISKFYGREEDILLDSFFVNTKRCYNSDEIRHHCTHYMNYFEKFYDTDKELLMIYARMKYLIDYEVGYNREAFFYDIKTYIFSPMMLYKVDLLNRDNYNLNLVHKTKTNPSIVYDNTHGMALMKLSFLINMVIPLMTHYAYIKDIKNIHELVLSVDDYILTLFDVDIYNKLYETTLFNVNKSSKHALWEKQDIRGKNMSLFTLSTVESLLLNVIPKYNYKENMIFFNYTNIRYSIKVQITDIQYEYNFIPLSSSKLDESNNSEFDRYEAYMIHADEALYIQNKVNCDQTMETISLLYGPFNQNEIQFYMDRITDVNPFQRDLVFNLFYKYFGDPVSIKSINMEQYIKLIIVAKRILQSNNMVILPYVISSKIKRIATRKNVNKKEYEKIINSSSYEYIMNKYKSDKIEKDILSLIATILSSEFEMIDYYDDNINNRLLESIPDKLSEEVLRYITLV